MKVVIPGGSGQVGALLARAFGSEGHEVVILARGKAPHGRVVAWDGKRLGPWASELDGADVVINLAGRSVNCRYTKENLEQMMSSRVDSTRVVGQAIAQARRPPRVWLQMSTATIYAHTYGEPNDEKTGVIGGSESNVPGYWEYSVRIANNWEAELAAAPAPKTRKVALRTAMVMSADEGGIFSVLYGLTRKGLGGRAGDGRQYVSWIHGIDFVRAVKFVLEHEEISGPVNFASPGPLPQKDFAKTLCRAAHFPIGLPAMKWMLELGAVFMRTDTELLLKSRRVVPGVLLRAGFKFEFADWERAANNLCAEYRPRTPVPAAK